MSSVMRKPAFCICEISCAVTALLISAFVFATWIYSTIPLLHKSEISSLVCNGPWRNPEDRFSREKAHMKVEQRFGAYI